MKINKITDHKLLVPWKIVNSLGKPVSFNNIIKPLLEYWRFKKNKESGEMELIDKRIIPIQKCSNVTWNVSEFFSYHNASEWNCPNWFRNKDSELGGYWDDEYIYYYNLVLSFFPQPCVYDINQNYTSLEKINNKDILCNNTYYISLMYPKYFFDPTNFDNPIQIKFMAYYYQLSPKLRKIDRIYFKKVSFQDDRGWMFQNILDKTFISVSKFVSDFTYIDEMSNNSQGDSNIYYNLVIYLDKDSDYIKRSYRKIQSLIAEVVGMLKLIMTCFTFISHFYNVNMRRIKLFEEIFDLKINKENSLNKRYF